LGLREVVRVEVHTTPGASGTRVGGEHDGLLVVRVTQRTVDGKATEAVRNALAEAIGVSPSQVRVVRGETSRRKLLEVDAQLVDVAKRVEELKHSTLADPPSRGKNQ
jgi:uncharacterized protein YggU (UPF0235/DUF167 family)